MQPASAARGANSFEIEPPVLNSAMSTPAKLPFVSSSMVCVPPSHSTVFPADLRPKKHILAHASNAARRLLKSLRTAGLRQATQAQLWQQRCLFFRDFVRPAGKLVAALGGTNKQQKQCRTMTVQRYNFSLKHIDTLNMTITLLEHKASAAQVNM